MTPRQFWIALVAIVLLALALRTIFPAADPPWRSTVGVLARRGAWTHNARTRLCSARAPDEWNRSTSRGVTALEYANVL